MIASRMTETLLPLDLLKSNEEASIVELCGDEPQVHRLAEMGLRVGATIRMVRPGAPCLLAIDGKRLSLRLNDGLEVLVAVNHPAVA
jgi:ferrous iron transport protein A